MGGKRMIELKRIVWHNEEAFERFFDGFREEVELLYKNLVKNGPSKKAHVHSWIEPLSKSYDALCVSSNAENVQKNYFILVEKLALKPHFTRVYRFYPDWNEKYTLIDGKDFILRSDYYDQFTDHIENVEPHTVHKPNLEYFKKYLPDILEKHYYSSNALLFGLGIGLPEFNEMLKGFPELAKKMTGSMLLKLEGDNAKRLRIDGCLFHFSDIIELGDILRFLNESSNISFLDKSKTLYDEISRSLTDDFIHSRFSLYLLYKNCKKKRAKSEKSAIEAKYSKAWLTKTNDGKEMIVIEWCNWNSYSYAYIIDKVTDRHVYFTCYQVYEDWYEGIEERPKKEYVKMLHDHYCNQTDYDKKPDLKMIKKDYQKFQPLFSISLTDKNESDSPLVRKWGDDTLLFDFGDFIHRAWDTTESYNQIDWFEDYE
jgi:hypothetical protein